MEKTGLAGNELVELRQLSQELSVWAFTDYQRARPALEKFRDAIHPKTPFDIRLAYHRYAAFLENQWQHFDQSLQHCSKAIDILEGLSDSLQLAEAWLDVVAVHLNRRDWPAAEDGLERARRYLNGVQQPRLSGQLACREGFLNLHLGNHRQALECLLEAEKSLSMLGEEASLKDYYVLSLAISGLGDLYERLDERDSSLAAYRRVLPVVELHDIRPRRAWHYLNAGRAALAQSSQAEAKEYFHKVLHYAGEGDHEAKAYALANLGILASLENDAPQAHSLFDEAVAQFQHPSKPSDFTNLSRIEQWRAGLYMNADERAKAEKQLEKAYASGIEGHDLNHVAQVCQALASLCAHRKDFEKAYDWQSRATQLTENHFRQVRDHERQELEARHQLERSRQEAQLARLRVASLQARALRAQMNPHFLFNALNAIQGFITSSRNSEAETYLARFAKLMRQTLDYSDKEVVRLDEEIDFLNKYLDLNRKLRFREKLDFSIIPPKGLDVDDLNIPTMIVQPFVENAVEHGLSPSREGSLRIEFRQTEDEESLLCIVEDNGIGYNKGKQKQSDKALFQVHRSRGMDITRERLTLLHGLRQSADMQYIRIIDLSEATDGARTGTRVEVLLPLLESEE